MATKYWIKFYHEVLDDPKMGRLPDNLWRRFFECCLLAGEANRDDGDPENGRLPPISDIAWRFRVEEETLRGEFDDMARRGLIEYRADVVLDGYWFVTSFDKRQTKMSKAEYMRRLRTKRAGMLPERDQSSYQPVTNGNAEENRIEKKRTEESAPAQFIHPDPEPITQIKTALATVSKTPLWAKTEDEYNDAAYALFGYDATPQKINGFAIWWEKNRWHAGKPAITTVLNEWTNYTSGVEMKSKQEQEATANILEFAVFGEGEK